MSVKYNLKFELSVLKVMYRDLEILKENILLISPKYFSDKMYRSMFILLQKYYLKRKTLPTRSVMVRIVKLSKDINKKYYKSYAKLFISYLKA